VRTARASTANRNGFSIAMAKPNFS
jgi:hypothetical protein